MTNRRRHSLVIPMVVGIIVVACYTGIRLLDLDRLVTSDEPLWLGRSANFFRALVSGELEYTYQMSHPGVMTMWAGTIAFFFQAPDYADHVRGDLTDPRDITVYLRQAGFDPLKVMVAAKVSKVLFQAAFFGISLWFLQRLFSWRVMAVAGFLIAFDPFLTGIDSAMHVDGMFAITSFAAILALAYAIQRGQHATWPWVGAGLLAACAWMTRSTGAALVMIAAGVLLLQVWRDKRNGAGSEAWDAPLRSGLLWLGSGVIVSLLLLPALVVELLTTLAELVLWPIGASLAGHEAPTFFLGEIQSGNAGWLFYPVTVLWRLSPVALLGIASFLLLGRHAFRTGLLTRAQLISIGILAAWVGMFVLGMSASAKKFDRYILAAYPFFGLIAALGIIWGAKWLSRRFGWPGRTAAFIVSIAIVVQLLSAVSVIPYRLDYYNPLWGGAEAAQDVLQMGWGQGGDQAAEFIIDEAGGERVTVMTSDFPSVYDYFTPETVMFVRVEGSIPENWQAADYIIVNMQQRQRDMDDFVPTLACTSPAFSVDVEGVRMMDVYRIADYVPCQGTP